MATKLNPVRLLQPEDILDVYGCQILLAKRLTDDEEAAVKARLYQIKDFYVNSAKARIRAEAIFCGRELKSYAFTLQELLEAVMEQVFKKMPTTETGRPNLMTAVLEAHKLAGTDLSGIDLKAFGVAQQEQPKPKSDVDPCWFKKGGGGRIWDNPKWHEISKAYLAIEAAQKPQDIVQAVDQLNGLQHNSFHVLIDLQSGRMLEEKGSSHEEAAKVLKKILDLKFESKSPIEYVDQMSAEIGKLVRKYEREK